MAEFPDAPSPFAGDPSGAPLYPTDASIGEPNPALPLAERGETGARVRTEWLPPTLTPLVQPRSPLSGNMFSSLSFLDAMMERLQQFLDALGLHLPTEGNYSELGMPLVYDLEDEVMLPEMAEDDGFDIWALVREARRAQERQANLQRPARQVGTPAPPARTAAALPQLSSGDLAALAALAGRPTANPQLDFVTDAATASASQSPPAAPVRPPVPRLSDTVIARASQPLRSAPPTLRTTPLTATQARVSPAVAQTPVIAPTTSNSGVQRADVTLGQTPTIDMPVVSSTEPPAVSQPAGEINQALPSQPGQPTQSLDAPAVTPPAPLTSNTNNAPAPAGLTAQANAQPGNIDAATQVAATTPTGIDAAASSSSQPQPAGTPGDAVTPPQPGTIAGSDTPSAAQSAQATDAPSNTPASSSAPTPNDSTITPATSRGSDAPAALQAAAQAQSATPVPASDLSQPAGAQSQAVQAEAVTPPSADAAAAASGETSTAQTQQASITETSVEQSTTGTPAAREGDTVSSAPTPTDAPSAQAAPQGTQAPTEATTIASVDQATQGQATTPGAIAPTAPDPATQSITPAANAEVPGQAGPVSTAESPSTAANNEPGVLRTAENSAAVAASPTSPSQPAAINPVAEGIASSSDVPVAATRPFADAQAQPTISTQPADVASTGSVRDAATATGRAALTDDFAGNAPDAGVDPFAPVPAQRSRAETVEVTLDWVIGADPWQQVAFQEQVRRTVRALATRGVRLQIVRGNAVSAVEYDADQAQPDGVFSIFTTRGPVFLDDLGYLAGAVLSSARPGALRLLMSPNAGPTTFAPDEQSLVFAIPPEEEQPAPANYPAEQDIWSAVRQQATQPVSQAPAQPTGQASAQPPVTLTSTTTPATLDQAASQPTQASAAAPTQAPAADNPPPATSTASESTQLSQQPTGQSAPLVSGSVPDAPSSQALTAQPSSTPAASSPESITASQQGVAPGQPAASAPAGQSAAAQQAPSQTQPTARENAASQTTTPSSDVPVTPTSTTPGQPPTPNAASTSSGATISPTAPAVSGQPTEDTAATGSITLAGPSGVPVVSDTAPAAASTTPSAAPPDRPDIAGTTPARSDRAAGAVPDQPTASPVPVLPAPPPLRRPVRRDGRQLGWQTAAGFPRVASPRTPPPLPVSAIGFPLFRMRGPASFAAPADPRGQAPDERATVDSDTNTQALASTASAPGSGVQPDPTQSADTRSIVASTARQPGANPNASGLLSSAAWRPWTFTPPMSAQQRLLVEETGNPMAGAAWLSPLLSFLQESDVALSPEALAEVASAGAEASSVAGASPITMLQRLLSGDAGASVANAVWQGLPLDFVREIIEASTSETMLEAQPGSGPWWSSIPRSVSASGNVSAAGQRVLDQQANNQTPMPAASPTSTEASPAPTPQRARLAELLSQALNQAAISNASNVTGANTLAGASPRLTERSAFAGNPQLPYWSPRAQAEGLSAEQQSLVAASEQLARSAGPLRLPPSIAGRAIDAPVSMGAVVAGQAQRGNVTGAAAQPLFERPSEVVDQGASQPQAASDGQASNGALDALGMPVAQGNPDAATVSLPIAAAQAASGVAGQSVANQASPQAAFEQSELPGAATEPVTITLDWVSGYDPWQSPEVLQQAEQATQALMRFGLRVHIERGRELALDDFGPVQGQSAAEFTVLSQYGPVPLSDLTLLNGASFISQSPGTLRVVLSPQQVYHQSLQADGGLSSFAFAMPPEETASGDAAALASATPSTAGAPSPRAPFTRLQSSDAPLPRPAGFPGTSLIPSDYIPAVTPRTFETASAPTGATASASMRIEPPFSFIEAREELLRAAANGQIFSTDTGTQQQSRLAQPNARQSGAPGQPAIPGRAASGQPAQDGTRLPLVANQPTISGSPSDLAQRLEAAAAARGDVPAVAQPERVAGARRADAITPNDRQADAELPSGRTADGLERVRIVVDWTAGRDPWREPAALQQTREILQRLERFGLRVELERGREISVQEEALQSQRASDFVILGPRGPVPLNGVALLEGASLVAQAPGSLRVRIPSQSPTTARNEDAAQAAFGEVGDMPFATQSVEVVLDWVAGDEPWSGSAEQLLSPEVVRQLERRGVTLDFVRGQAVPESFYADGVALPAGALAVFGPRGPVSLNAIPWLDQAVPVAQRPGNLRLILPPTTARQGRQSFQQANVGEQARRESQQGSLGGVTEMPWSSVDATGTRPSDAGVAAPWGDVPWQGDMSDGARPFPVNIMVFDADREGQEPSSFDFVSSPSQMGTVVRNVTTFDAGATVLAPAGATRPSAYPASGDAAVQSNLVFAGPGDASALPIGMGDVAAARPDRSGVSGVAAAAQPSVTSMESGLAPESSGPERPNLDLLARQVYAQIKQRLSVERERLGRSGGFGRW